MIWWIDRPLPVVPNERSSLWLTARGNPFFVFIFTAFIGNWALSLKYSRKPKAFVLKYGCSCPLHPLDDGRQIR